jgi:predicted metal-binding membrane protein
MSRLPRTFLLALSVGSGLAWAAAAAQAASSNLSAASAPGLQLAFNGCGHNYYRAPNGQCDIVRNPNQDCPEGSHSVPAPTPSGYRCVRDGY